MTKVLSDKIRVAIAGATGYGGLELIRLVSQHPQAQITYLASVSSAGKRLEEIYPHLAEIGSFDSTLQPLEPKAIAKAADIMLLALPAGKSAVLIPQLLEGGMKVVDGGPDFRLHDASAYPRWYKFEHPAPELLKEAVFGIPELHKAAICRARLVAQPGCYATAAILALAPALKAGFIGPEIIIDAKSGLSGAGRTSLSLPYHFTEAAEDVSAYGFPAHRHLPEIEQELGLLMSGALEINFTPHLVPTIRGIFATAYAGVERSAFSVQRPVESTILQKMKAFYADSPFVHVSENLPHTKWTSGTNHAFLSARVTPDGKRAVLLSVIDNLGKGLSGQMVQCMNLMFGLEETAGLEARAVYP